MKSSLLIILSLMCSLMAFADNDSLRLAYERKHLASEDKVLTALDLARDWYSLSIDSSLWYAVQAERIADEIGYKFGLGRAKSYIGAINMHKADYQAAYKAMKAYQEIMKEIGDSIEISHSYNNLGVLFENLSIYEEAIQNYSKGLQIRQRHGDESEVIQSLYNLTILIAMSLESREEASKYLPALLRFADSNPTETVTPMIYNAAGFTWLLRPVNYDSAYYFLHKALQHFDVANSQAKQYIHNNLARVFLGLNQLDSAEYHALQALNHITSLEASYDIGHRKALLGSVYIKQKRFEEAKEIINQSKVIFRELNHADYYGASLIIESELYEAMGEWEKALALYKEGKQTVDSVLNANMRQRIAWMRAITDEERLTFEKNVLEKDLALEREKIIREESRRNILLVIIGSVLLFTLLVIIRYFEKGKINRQLTRLNQELKQSQQQLQELNNSKDRFFGLLGHDLRNPLMAFERLSQRLAAGHQQNIQEVSIQLARQAKVLSNLLNNLLIWSKAEQGLLSMKPQAILLHQIVDESLELYQAQASEKNLQLINHTDPDMLGFADKESVMTIVRNIISNAVKFTETGSVEVRSSTNNGEALLCITDTGPGIGEENAEEIFQLSGKQTSGLGLLLSKELAGRNNCRLWIESKQGSGTSVYLSIPIFSFDEDSHR
jgi:signal transduction histidine kinase